MSNTCFLLSSVKHIKGGQVFMHKFFFSTNTLKVNIYQAYLVNHTVLHCLISGTHTFQFLLFLSFFSFFSYELPLQHLEQL